MIRSDSEYRAAVARLEEARMRLAENRANLIETGLGAAHLERALDPLRSFQLKLEEEIESYGRLQRGDVGELLNLHGLGHMLVALRVARGLTQRELASRLGVHESQVSRDERNQYHGVTVERASRVLDAMGVQLLSSFEQPILPGGTPETEGVQATE